jgi:hypothetical protein
LACEDAAQPIFVGFERKKERERVCMKAKAVEGLNETPSQRVGGGGVGSFYCRSSSFNLLILLDLLLQYYTASQTLN